jgi:hypothetical protein
MDEQLQDAEGIEYDLYFEMNERIRKFRTKSTKQKDESK